MATKIEQYAIDQVKSKRLAMGLSQAALAADAGLSYGFIGNVESNKYRAKYNLNHLNALAIALKCSIYDFLPPQPIMDNAEIKEKGK